MSYNSKYKGVEVDALLDKVNDIGEIPTKVSELDNDSAFITESQVDKKLTSKQNVISDLSTIRSNASKGATALQPQTGGSGNKFLSDKNTYEEIDLSGKQDKVSVVDHGTEETTFTLTPNTLHIWGEVASLSLGFGESVDGSLSEYMFRFSSGDTPTTLTLPDSVSWANGMEVSIQSGKTYEVAVIDGYGCILEFDTISSILTFTLRNKEYQFDKGMTWGEWVDSEYNVDGFVIQNDEATYQYEVVCIETIDSGWSGTHYLIADPDKSSPTHVLKTEIVQSKEYTEFEDNYGAGGGDA